MVRKRGRLFMKIKAKILAILSAVTIAVIPTMSTTVYGAGGSQAGVVNIEKVFEEKEGYTPDYSKVVFEVKAKTDIKLEKETATSRYINPIHTFDPDTEGQIPSTTDKGEYKAGEVIGTFSMTQPDPNGAYEYMKKSVTSLVTISPHVSNGETYELTLQEVATDPAYEVDSTIHTLTIVTATGNWANVYIDGVENWFPMPLATAGGTYIIRPNDMPNNLIIENKLKSSQTPEDDKKPETGKDEQPNTDKKPATDKKEEVKPKGENKTVQKAKKETKPSYPETGVETLNPLIGVAGFVVLVLGAGYFYKKFKQK